MEITVHASGPLFNGAFPGVMQEILQEAQTDIGEAAIERVHDYLNRQIKHPTPYYETQIIAQRRGPDVVVHDRGIIYGPWLEGTSSRNRTTRFKGYASFRKATQDVQKVAPDILARVIARNIGRLGGTP